MRDPFILRIRIVYILIFSFGILILGRLFFVQVLNSHVYREEANQQYFVSPAQYFDRGTIFLKDKDGQLVSVASIKKGFLLAINPTILEKPEDAYEKISQIIPLDKDLFFKCADKKDDIYEEVASKISQSDKEKIEALDINGVNLYSQNWRYYPASNLASRVLGFVGFNENVIEGRYGLEKYYESILNKASGDFSLNNPFAEIIIDFKKLISGIPEKGDVVTTIEPEVQILLEKSLNDLLEKYSSEMAGGLIMDPQTGRIIAMAVKPDFDPNRYNEEKISLFSNPIVQSVFEMGSIMKPLTLAAALNEGVITPQTTYEDKGYVVFNNKRIENYDGKGHGVVNMQEVLNNSLNTGAVFAMEKLGKEKFKDYIINYGLGEKTGIDLPDEIQGLISNLDSNRDVEYATASFGQGIAVTPIEMISALASLANGGILVKPFIVEEIKNDQGFSRKIEPETRRQVLSQQTSKEISRMLSNVADYALLGGTVKLERYTIAAKTGTAQYKAEGEAGYREGEYIHTFFGYAPAFNARFITFLFLVRPQGARYASNSLTKPFMDITKFLLNYYQVPPDR